jgi:hypothetical protein
MHLKAVLKTKADTLKETEANRKRGPGTREKVRKKKKSCSQYIPAF